jgi:putative restriction endonuclease
VPTLDEVAFRESAFAWLRTKLLTQSTFSRDELAEFQFNGEKFRLTGAMTGIWKPKALSSAISILTAFTHRDEDRPYEDGIGADGMLRYKWRGTDPNIADNRWLRDAMTQQAPIIWFLGVDYKPGSQTQVFQPIFPVWLVAEEPQEHQFVVALEAAQRALVHDGRIIFNEVERIYNERLVKTRVHQPMFRLQVLRAYKSRCAVCRLPFEQLLEAAHIKSDAEGGSAHITNGISLCKIHHGAYDSLILGISPDYKVHIREDVLRTQDGPVLMHALNGMNNKPLGQIPDDKANLPNPDLLEERFKRFKEAS